MLHPATDMNMKGFSARNLEYIRKFAESWRDRQLVQRTVAQIPWRSNLALLDKIKDLKQRLRNRTTNHTNDTNGYERLGMVYSSVENQVLKGSTLEPLITQIKGFFYS